MNRTQINDPQTFDTALLRFARPHILQSSHWAALKAPVWTHESFLWGEIEQPLAAASILTRRLGRLPLGIQYVPKGPLVASADGWPRLLAELERHARRSRALFIKIDPDVDAESSEGQALMALLRQRGWVFSNEQIQFRNTLLSDLRLPEDELLAAMKQKTRYNIRLAAKRGVQVQSSDDFAAFYRLYAETARRDGFLIRPQAYYLRVMQRLHRAGLSQLLLAYYNGQPIAGVYLFRFGPTAWYFYGASSNVHRKHMPNYLLQWQAIRWAKSQGCTTYDWWGAPDTLDENDAMGGVLRFKLGFGAQIRRWIGAWDYTPWPRLYRFYTTTMPHILSWMRRRA